MINKDVDIAIIGGGAAGLSAAIGARKNKIENLIIIERNERLGGILNQSIHPGFGLKIFNEELTGPEYAQRFINEIENLKIPYLLNATVIDLNFDKFNKKKELIVVTRDGILNIKSKAVILAMGCRERTRGMIKIPGTRAAGIYTAGTAQYFINIEGYKIGKNVVILGSGDVGLIMARRLALEGANVIAVIEILPYLNGLHRNIVQCIYDFNIPIFLNHTVIDIEGDKRVKSVTIAKVDENRNPIPGTERKIECDTLLLSVGLIPENELSKKVGIEINPLTNGPIVNENFETSISGIFACGNVLHIHDLVDWVTITSEFVGKNAAEYVKNGIKEENRIEVISGEGISYVVPSFISGKKDVRFFMRVLKPYKNRNVLIKNENDEIIIKNFFPSLNPPQMVVIDVNKENLKKAKSKIKFCVENE